METDQSAPDRTPRADCIALSKFTFERNEDCHTETGS